IDEGLLNACGTCGPVPAEVCDGIDNDCDGQTDEGLLNACGFCGEDLLDICDGVDNDCDGLIDEGCGDSPETCDGEDCDDDNPETCDDVEVCDGIDNDCDGQIDEGLLNACGTCGPVPTEVCDGIDNDCDGQIDEELLNACGTCGDVPTEVCDGIDNDCDGQIDEELLNACGVCGDVPTEVCDGIDNDCDGQIDEELLNACGVCGDVPTEVCDGIDNDCDGQTDEGLLNVCGTCGEVLAEVCDGIDNDCDGQIDEEGCEACEPTGENLVVNGSFEDGVEVESWDIYTSSALPGWTVEWVNADACEDPTQEPVLELHHALLAEAQEGRLYAELDSDCQGPGGSNGEVERPTVRISQHVSTVPGNRYELSFTFIRRGPRSNGAEVPGEQTLTVTWGGNEVFQAEAPTEWERRTMVVTATAFSEELTLADTGLANTLGVFLDDVRVVDLDGDCGCPEHAEAYALTNAVSDPEAHGANHNHGIVLGNLFCDDANAKFTFQDDDAHLILHGDGTARLVGTATLTSGGCGREGEIWNVDVWLDEAVQGTVEPKLELRAGFQPTAITDAWRFFIMREGSASMSHPDTGAEIFMSHRPADLRYGFQVGETANGKNLNLGASGWFGYDLVEGDTTQSGVGDFNIDLGHICR
ncbi:MAG: MopE-related protein, partial [Myxococcota bacterium]